MTDADSFEFRVATRRQGAARTAGHPTDPLADRVLRRTDDGTLGYTWRRGGVVTPIQLPAIASRRVRMIDADCNSRDTDGHDTVCFRVAAWCSGDMATYDRRADRLA